MKNLTRAKICTTLDKVVYSEGMFPNYPHNNRLIWRGRFKNLMRKMRLRDEKYQQEKMAKPFNPATFPVLYHWFSYVETTETINKILAGEFEKFSEFQVLDFLDYRLMQATLYIPEDRRYPNAPTLSEIYPEMVRLCELMNSVQFPPQYLAINPKSAIIEV